MQNLIKKIENKIKEADEIANKKIFIHTHTAVREVDEKPTQYLTY